LLRVLGLALALALVLAGCTTYSVQAPIGDRSDGPRRTPNVHQVRRGDTLYSISFLYGLSVEELAAWNGLRPPYTIYRGQHLRLKPGRLPVAPAPQAAQARASQPKPRPGSQARVQPPAAASAPVMRPATPRSGPAPLVGSVPKVAGGAKLKPPPGGDTAGRAVAAAPLAAASAPAVVPVPASAVEPVTAPAQAVPEAAAAQPDRSDSDQPVFWSWPVDGRLIRGYDADSTGKKGIDIAGDSGDTVRAAAAGKVVYAGSGLSGYGRLIIIKHNKDFLSAYAHNRKLIAREGQWVNKGEVIAQMGSSGTDRTQLHFEIRKQGRPVDPLRYLPKR